MRSSGMPTARQCSIASLSGPSPSSSSPPKTVIQMSSTSSANPWSSDVQRSSAYAISSFLK